MSIKNPVIDWEKVCCRNCGSPQLRENGKYRICASCGTKYEAKIEESKLLEEIRSIADEITAKRVSALRQQLYEKISAKYIDADAKREIVDICKSIRNYLPDDFCACFYQVANGGDINKFAEFIEKISIDNENYPFVEGMIRFALKSLKKELITPLTNLIESAYEGKNISLYKEIRTVLENEVKKLERGYYDLNIPRDAFILYSSKDIKQVEKLVKELERQKIKCFYAARNLQHGVDAKSDYEEALETAMNRCSCVVLVSSRNSRDPDCQAYYHELKYLRERDEIRFPVEWKNRDYRDVPKEYKKPRVEYLIEDYEKDFYADIAVKEFFHGLDYCGKPQEVAKRIYEIKNATNVSIPADDSHKPRSSTNTFTPSYTPSASTYYGSSGSKSRREKTKKVGLVVAIAAALALLIGLGVFLIPNLFNNRDDGNNKNTVSSVVNSEYGISVSTSQGDLPASTTFAVEEVEADSHLSEIISELPIKQGNYHLYNMNLINNGETFNFGKNLVVSMYLPAGISADKAVVYYISNSSSEKIVCSVLDNKLSFTTNHFSIYLIGEMEESSQPVDKISRISYNPNGGTGDMAIQSFKMGESVQLAPCSFVRNGYSFVGWAVSEKGSVVYMDEAFVINASSSEISLYAVWEANVNSLFFNSNGGSGIINSISAKTDETVNLPNNLFVREGYTFMGWSEVPNGAIKYTNCQSIKMLPDETLTLYAVWSANLNSLVLKANDGTNNEATISIKAGETKSLPATPFTRNGYTFKGWSTTSMGSVEFKDRESYTMGSSSVTLYAIWEANINLIVFDPNGGSGTMSNQSARTDEQLILNTCRFSREGYAFLGWSTSENGEAVYQDKSAYLMGSDSSYTLYATWKKIYSPGLTYVSNRDSTCYVSSIGECTDTEILIPETSPYGEKVVRIGKEAFMNCRSITTVVIPDSVTAIEAGAFRYCHALVEVNLPAGVEIINEYTFYSCDSLERISLPESVKTISSFAFAYCDSLKNLTISFGLKEIESFAFDDCESLEEIILPESLESIGSAAFMGCKKLENIHIPSGVISIGSYPFEACTALTSITVDNDNQNYKDIHGNLYSQNGMELIQYAVGKLNKSFTVPSEVEKIASGAFSGCKELNGVIIQSGVTDIGSMAFENCSNLASITIPFGVKSIGFKAFYACSNLLEINIPNSVTSIGFNAFSYCTGLMGVTIPSSVKNIGYGPFEYCSSLVSIAVDSNNEIYKSIDGNLYTIDGKRLVQYAVGKNEESFTIPLGVEKIGQSAFCGCKNLVEIIIPNCVAGLESLAFFGCDKLTVVTIPDSVTEINSFTFISCDALKEIYLGSNVSYIGSSAFDYRLEKIYFNGTAKEWNAIKKDGNIGIKDSCEIIFLK